MAIYMWREEEVYPTESIVMKMKADSSGNLYVPIAGFGSGGNQKPDFSWNISIDGGVPTAYTKSDAGAGYQLTVATGLTPESEHTIIISPVTLAYGWGRAWGCSGSIAASLLTEVIQDGGYYAYALSDTDTGRFYGYQQYYNCVNLRKIPQEEMPNTVTTIGKNFRKEQYYGCVSLTEVPDEVMSNAVTKIGDGFRESQYQDCVGILETGLESLSSLVTGTLYQYRYKQYMGCYGIITIKGIQATPSTITHGGNFRQNQFDSAGNTITPMTVTINGSDIETGQTNSLGLADANVAQIKVDASLVTAYQSSNNWSNIDDSKFVSL